MNNQLRLVDENEIGKIGCKDLGGVYWAIVTELGEASAVNDEEIGKEIIPTEYLLLEPKNFTVAPTSTLKSTTSKLRTIEFSLTYTLEFSLKLMFKVLLVDSEFHDKFFMSISAGPSTFTLADILPYKESLGVKSNVTSPTIGILPTRTEMGLKVD